MHFILFNGYEVHLFVVILCFCTDWKVFVEYAKHIDGMALGRIKI